MGRVRRPEGRNRGPGRPSGERAGPTGNVGAAARRAQHVTPRPAASSPVCFPRRQVCAPKRSFSGLLDSTSADSMPSMPTSARGPRGWSDAQLAALRDADRAPLGQGCRPNTRLRIACSARVRTEPVARRVGERPDRGGAAAAAPPRELRVAEARADLAVTRHRRASGRRRSARASRAPTAPELGPGSWGGGQADRLR
jgi:hypothetical protein